MRKRGLMHLVGAMAILAIYVLAATPLAAQDRIVQLPSGEGINFCQQKSDTTDAVDAINITFCKGSVGGFAITGFGNPGEVQVFKVTQTVPGILEFSNFREGLYTETIDVAVTILADGSGQSDPFYARGANLGQSVFSACNPQLCAINQVSALVVNVASLEWEELNSPLDTNPNAGGGFRMFPDKTSPDDTVPRKTVLIKATLSSAQPGITVYFKAYDVDDPSSDHPSLDANGFEGRDNRQVQGLDAVVPATTDSSGVARVVLTVSMQPGDNYKLTAACDPVHLNNLLVIGTEVRNPAGQTLPTEYANVTPVLTVWRRLHIELDSMGPVTGNVVTGVIARAQPRRRSNYTILTIDTLYGTLPDDATRFIGERITIDGLGSFVVQKYDRRRIRVEGIVEDLASLGKSFRLVDDDDFNDDDGAVKDGDQGEDIPSPDLSLIQDSDDPAQNVFAPAYVRPIYDIGDSNDNAGFVLNTPGAGTPADLISTYDFDSEGTHNNSEFWTVYLLGAYQYAIAADGDGEGNVTFGAADGRFGARGASVFFEGLSEGTPTTYFNNAATTAHEIGHLFSGDHFDGGLMEQSGTRASLAFTEITLNFIRSITNP